MADCDIPVGLSIPGPDEVSACAETQPPPCPTPPLPEKASASGPTPICYPDGSMIYAVANSTQPINTVCPVVPGEDPAWVGYWTQDGAWNAGDPPAGWVPCGAQSDVELAGRVCLVDTTTGEYAGSLFIEATYDNTVNPPVSLGYVLAALLPDGTWQRPFVPAANLKQEPCPSASPIALPMHECVNGDCVMFVRWYNPVLGSVIFDRNLDGTPYTVNDPTLVQVGYCLPPTTPVAEIMHECLAGECVEFVRWYCPSNGVVLFNRDINGSDYLIIDATKVMAGPCPTDTVVVEVVQDVQADQTCIPVELVKTIACDGTITVAYFTLAGVPYTPIGSIAAECPCAAPSTREAWHRCVEAGAVASVAFKATDATLPEPIANAINGTSNQANPGGFFRWLPKTIHGAALASGGNWTEPGVVGGVASNPAGWYNYSGPVSPLGPPVLWPYNAVRLSVEATPGCVLPASMDVNASFQWRYDGPQPPAIGANTGSDRGIFAWLLDITTGAIYQFTNLAENVITALGQTGAISLAAAGVPAASINNLAVVIAVNTGEAPGDDLDYQVIGGEFYTKRTGYTVSQLQVDVIAPATCGYCEPLFRETWCDGIRWRNIAGGTIAEPAVKTFGPCPASTVVVEVVGYNDPAGCRPVEVVKTINGCDASLSLAGHEMSGAPIAGFNPALVIAACPCPPTTQLGVLTSWAPLQ